MSQALLQLIVAVATQLTHVNRNRSGLFPFLSSYFAYIFLQIVSIRVKTLRNTHLVASRRIERENASLPVDVRRSKTSLLKLANIPHSMQSSDTVIIYRFLGTSMDSTAARPILRSLCMQLRRIYSKDPNEVANDFKTLCEEFIQNLKLATNGQPLFLFLDSLDQMTDEDNGRNLEWLPFELPSDVKIVVSTLPEEGGCLNKLRLSLPDEGLVEVGFFLYRMRALRRAASAFDRMLSTVKPPQTASSPQRPLFWRTVHTLTLC